MRIDVLTIFPEAFDGPLGAGILRRAREAGLADVRVHDLRGWADEPHRKVDDETYGGGSGMVMRIEPIHRALASLGVWPERGGARTVLLSPQGRVFRHEVAAEFAALPRLVLLCGRYEGVDERVREHLVDEECSIGDYVLSGGEPAAHVVIDAVVRLLPGAVGKAASVAEDSHAAGLLDHPHYTRPPEYLGWTVPEVLRTGDHERIRRWRKRKALEATFRKRPDLLVRAALDEEARRMLQEIRTGEADRDNSTAKKTRGN